MGVDDTSLDRIRNATFPSVRRGYDKHEVEKFLGRLADWLETGGGDESHSDAVKRELERVGERTGAILAQAEESAQQIRAEAEEDARGTINSANLQATESRTEAENYANETRTSAERQAREVIEAAEADARQIIADANERREDMEAVIGDLLRRREDVISDTEQLSRTLAAAVAQHRSEGFELPEQLDPLADDEDVEPEPSSETEVAETEVAAEQPDTEEHTITAEREVAEDRPEHEADLRT
jgi:DivIVA domain-containing protein